VATATGFDRAFSSRRNVGETRSKHRAATLTSLNLGALSGYTIGITADRRWQEQAELLERRGARVQHGPAIRTFPLYDEEGLRAATHAVVDDPPDIVVLITALGTRGWMAAAESMGMGDALLKAIAGAEIYARGPKAAGAAITASLDVSWKAPDAKTSQIAEHLIAERAPGRHDGSASPLRVAVQLDGSEDRWIAEELIAAGFDVVPVPIYRWTMPIDPAPACRMAQAVADATIDAVTFTAGPALANFVELASEQGCLDEMLRSFNDGRVAAVCVGPVCAEKAHRLGIARTIEPNHARLGAMVQACASAFNDRGLSFSLAGHELCMQGRVVLVDDDEPIALSDRERDVLEVLAQRPGSVHSKAALLKSVWGGNESDEHVVEVTVGRLRHRLGAAGRGIETVVRRGYRLAAD
jgi:uroporphyrinogen-III synthase